MKKYLLLLLTSFSLVSQSHSQSVTIGAKGLYGINWMLNKNVSDDVDASYKSNFCNAAGVSVAWYFNARSYYSSVVPGVNLDILYANYSQTVSGMDSGHISQTTQLSYLDLPLLFRITPEFGPYFEIGPQFSYLLGATGSMTNTRPNVHVSVLNGDMKKFINKINLAAVVGAGVDIDISDYITFILGFRFGYGFTDLSSPQKKISTNYEPTHLLFAGGMAGIVFTLNYFH